MEGDGDGVKINGTVLVDQTISMGGEESEQPPAEKDGADSAIKQPQIQFSHSPSSTIEQLQSSSTIINQPQNQISHSTFSTVNQPHSSYSTMIQPQTQISHSSISTNQPQRSILLNLLTPVNQADSSTDPILGSSLAGVSLGGNDPAWNDPAWNDHSGIDIAGLGNASSGIDLTGNDFGGIDLAGMDSVDQDLADQDQELKALGISVVDQSTLERDVEAAVDKAVAQHTRKQRFKILQKEVTAMKMKIKQGDIKTQDLRNRLSGMRQRVVDPRKYMSVEEDMRAKLQENSKLRARLSLLQQKLSAAEDNQEELDDYDMEDGEIGDEDDEGEEAEEAYNKKIEAMSVSEREKLIREGQMTPFGTAMTNASSKTGKTISPFSGKKKLNLAKEDARPLDKKLGRGVDGPKKSLYKGPSKAEMISSGEMTPFGTVMRSEGSHSKTSKQSSDKPSGGITDFEKYLQDQISRQKQHSVHSTGKKKSKKTGGDPTYGIPKKRKGKLKEYIGEEECDEGVSLSAIKRKAKASFESDAAKRKQESPAKSKRGDPLKKHILHPKKRKVEKKLGSVTSALESDMNKATPRRILSEKVSLEESEQEDYDEGSGSEYVPSDREYSEKEDPDYNEENLETSPKKKKSSSRIEKLEKGKKRKRKRKKDSEDEWSEDDYEDDVPANKKSKALKYRDDGNLSDYVQRIEAWKEDRLRTKQAKILRGEDLDSDEEEEEGYEEFDGGFKIPLAIWNKLYKYQRTCVRWLWELHGQGCGGILGDEMGLGKTIEIISFLVGISYSGLYSKWGHWKGLGPVVVVCPATVLHQWVKEFQKWWPPFRVAVLHDSGSFTGTRAALISNISRHGGILVTSYTGVRDQLETLLQYSWHYVILDEGHKIRNPEAQITVAVKRFQTPHRLILSGSPIQNSLKELWSLFDFVFPGKLGTLQVFLQQFAVPITQGGYANASKLEVQTAFKCASMLRDTINPYLLRRMKNDVRSHLNLPDKNEQVLFCELSDEQRKIYREYVSGDQVNNILTGRMKVFVGLINLRKICNHPDLYTGGPRSFDNDYTSELQPELRYGYWQKSGKMHVLKSVLRLWSRQGHRALLFTQSRQMMCILERFLMDEEHTYVKMDGTTSVSARQPLIEKFNKDESLFVFLLTTRVGGLGVNLTGADRVVIFDPDWNPSTDSQARERAWRIGQLRHVTIYRLLTAGTIEEKIYHRQIFKQFLTNRVLKDPKQTRFFKTNDLFELFSFTEGVKEKTESSAIFAGTGSEINMGKKRNSDDDDDDDDEGRSEKENKLAKLKQTQLFTPKISKGKLVRPESESTPGNSQFSHSNQDPQALHKPPKANRKEVAKSDDQASEKQGKTRRKEMEGKLDDRISEKKGRASKKEMEAKSDNNVREKDRKSGKKSKERMETEKDMKCMSQIERMREMAKRLSQKIGNKEDGKGKKDEVRTDDNKKKEKDGKEGGIGKNGKEEGKIYDNNINVEIDKVSDNQNQGETKEENGEIVNEQELKNESETNEKASLLVQGEGEDNMLNSKMMVDESEKDKTINTERESSVNSVTVENACIENNTKSLENKYDMSEMIELRTSSSPSNRLENAVPVLELKENGEKKFEHKVLEQKHTGMLKPEYTVLEQKNKEEKKLEHTISQQRDKEKKKSEHATFDHKDSDRKKHKNKRKEKDRDRHRDREKDHHGEKHHKHKKGKKFEGGERIEYLLKKRKYRKTEEEEEAERDNSKSQDQYVLERLFKNSGVHTALSHDAIINNSDPDYLLVESEAERVAKEALKAVRASRAWCLKPRAAGPTSTDDKLEKKPKFGKKKSKVFADEDSDKGKEKEKAPKKKNKPMFNGGIDDDDDEEENSSTAILKIGEGRRGFNPYNKRKEKVEGSSGVITSSQLLSRMRNRNKGIALESDTEDSDYDPDYPSTAPSITERDVEPEIQENIDLLADIRNFVAFQAEVDGKASTQEIVGRFRERLPPEQTPFFKALLTEICEFHRETSGKGVWSLKAEFR